MAQPSDSVVEPIPISYISGRYLLFDVDVVTYLRKTYNICGVLIGSIPQIPQQNVFLGIPLELLPEEAKLLVHKEVAYIVDDAKWHVENFRSMSYSGTGRTAYLGSLRSQGLAARKQADETAAIKAQIGLAKQRKMKAKKESLPTISNGESTNASPGPDQNNPVLPLASASDAPSTADTAMEDSLFNDPPASAPRSAPALSVISSSKKPLTLTPPTSYTPKSLPETTPQLVDVKAPASYPLYEHLHSKGYFVTPGLRFGCDYTCYPGDPLRYHSHFLAVGYEWDQQIPLIDIIGGGRLGTGVKKGFLIGGAEVPLKTPSNSLKKDQPGDVRTFCIEWGGM